MQSRGSFGRGSFGLAAIQIGGCGSWNGLGELVVFGKDQCLPLCS